MHAKVVFFSALLSVAAAKGLPSNLAALTSLAACTTPAPAQSAFDAFPTLASTDCSPNGTVAPTDSLSSIFSTYSVAVNSWATANSDAFNTFAAACPAFTALASGIASELVAEQFAYCTGGPDAAISQVASYLSTLTKAGSAPPAPTMVGLAGAAVAGMVGVLAVL